MAIPGVERRRYGRIRLDAPMTATYGETPVKVLEVSLRGFLIAHEGRLDKDQPRRLRVEWDGVPIDVECLPVRSKLWRLAKRMGEQSVYHSGLSTVDFERDSFDRLRRLIADRIVRALEEQKANARGIPPLAAYMYQPEKGELYRRCELIDGTWRKTETIRPTQPPHGFTVSAEVDPRHVEMLCRTWESTTAEGRRLTQLLAELSISRTEGIATRRYVP